MKKSVAIILSIILILVISIPAAAITSSIPVKGITLDNSAITLTVGQTSNLKVTLTPENTTQKLITYVTSNVKVATIDKTGKITAVGAGSATIIVYTPDKNIFAVCTVTVLSKTEKVSLTMWAAPAGIYAQGQQPGVYVYENLIPEWNKLYPNVKINAQLVPWDGINEKVTVAIQSKTLPDIYFDGTLRILSYANMGAVLSLNNVIPKADLDQFLKNPSVMANCSVNGKDIVASPYTGGAIMLMVNKRLWENVGAANLLPQDEYKTWTLDEFKTALKAVANKDKGIYGLTMYALNEQGDQLYNNIIMAATDSQLFSNDLSKYIADNPDTVKVLEFFKSLVDEGLVTPHPETLSSSNAMDYFFQGKNGMWNASSAHVGLVQSAIKNGTASKDIDMTYVNYPSKTKGKSTIIMNIGNNCAFKSGYPVRERWAKQFVIWTDTQSQVTATVNKWLNMLGKPNDWVNTDPNYQLYAKIAGKALSWGINLPTFGIKGYSEMRAAQFPEMQSMFIGKTTPQQTIDNISKKFNDIIAKYNH